MNSTILDVHDDSLKVIYKQVQTDFAVPEFIKTANYELGDFGRSEKKLFAHPIEKRLPLDTESDVWMSAAYVEKNASQYTNFERSYIDREINRVATLMGIDLPKQKAKEASYEFEIPVDKFAISIPMKEIKDETFLQKAANYAYNNHFVLYPLDTEENIKRCNNMFPIGLDGSFEAFRPKIASEIVNALPSDINPSQEVKKYLPLSKKSSLTQLEYRSLKAPKFASEYKALEPLLNNNTIAEYAAKLVSLDKQAGLGYLYSSNFFEPMRFLNGIKDDTVIPEDKKIKLAGKELTHDFIIRKSASIENIFPELKEIKTDADKVQSLFDNQPEKLQHHLMRKMYE